MLNKFYPDNILPERRTEPYDGILTDKDYPLIASLRGFRSNHFARLATAYFLLAKISEN